MYTYTVQYVSIKKSIIIMHYATKLGYMDDVCRRRGAGCYMNQVRPGTVTDMANAQRSTGVLCIGISRGAGVRGDDGPRSAVISTVGDERGSPRVPHPQAQLSHMSPGLTDGADCENIGGMIRASRASEDTTRPLVINASADLPGPAGLYVLTVLGLPGLHWDWQSARVMHGSPRAGWALLY